VCTCIGEEGLDVGEVDLVINYDVITSPIRNVQRSGRTGRKREGKVVSLVMAGKEENDHKNAGKKQQALTKSLKSVASGSKKLTLFKEGTPLLPCEPQV
jgi:ERCC4-related helicase